jgi:hypothetical protein
MILVVVVVVVVVGSGFGGERIERLEPLHRQ